ncbi:hypothetical protein ABIC94_001748 [Variovorax paradoxus]|uniref:Pr6Pr family membrane protein n=1 Tax=Variovorax paradoxus TaxID=34073 RepID=UPI00339B000B
MKNMNVALARLLHGVVALAALSGIGLELAAAITGGAGAAPTHLERFVRLFSYFTIDANIVYAFARGAFVSWYPYPFMDVGALGFGRAVLNSVVVAVIFLVMAFGLRLLEKQLPSAPAA